MVVTLIVACVSTRNTIEQYQLLSHGVTLPSVRWSWTRGSRGTFVNTTVYEPNAVSLRDLHGQSLGSVWQWWCLTATRDLVRCSVATQMLAIWKEGMALQKVINLSPMFPYMCRIHVYNVLYFFFFFSGGSRSQISVQILCNPFSFIHLSVLCPSIPCADDDCRVLSLSALQQAVFLLNFSQDFTSLV